MEGLRALECFVIYKARLLRLLDLLASGQQSAIQCVANKTGKESKRRAFEELKANNAEGVVFKRIWAPYSPGRPNSDGDQLKYKFVETASVIVNAINAKRSVAIAVWDSAPYSFRSINGMTPVFSPVNWRFPVKWFKGRDSRMIKGLPVYCILFE